MMGKQLRTKQQKKILKIVAVSDTHGNNQDILKLIENKESGDFFIHAGDFTRYGKQQNFKEFFDILKRLNFKHKIVIAGNHEINLDLNINPQHKKMKSQKYPCKYSRTQLIQNLKKHAIYLEHQYVEIQGIKIFGSLYVKKYGRSAFQYEHQLDQILWKNIPQIDILITHSPPFGILDKSNSGKHGGSECLRQKVFQIKPKLHFFGHIHQSKGHHKQGQIYFFNLAKSIVRLEKQI